MTKTLYYDCEVINPIRTNSDWTDYKYLGISVIGVDADWLLSWKRYQYFVLDPNYFWSDFKEFKSDMDKLLFCECSLNDVNLEIKKFKDLISEADQIIGFNSLSFDDKLCQAHKIDIKTDYDLLCEVRKASNQPPNYVRGRTRSGYSLEALAQANLGYGKTGTGALVPELWREGKYQEVINYCLNDVKLLVRLHKLFERGKLFDPTNGRRLPYDKNKTHMIFFYNPLSAKERAAIYLSGIEKNFVDEEINAWGTGGQRNRYYEIRRLLNFEKYDWDFLMPEKLQITWQVKTIAFLCGIKIKNRRLQGRNKATVECFLNILGYVMDDV